MIIDLGNGRSVADDNPVPTRPTGTVVKDTWSGNANITKTFTAPRNTLLIANDGSTDVVLNVNGLSFTIKSTEVFDERLDPFTTLTLSTTSAYRAWARG